MSTIDENQIRDRLEQLSKIKPAPEAAERAMQRVRRTLVNEHTRAKTARARIFRAFLGSTVPRLAAAAVVLICAGYVCGRVSAPRLPVVDELQAALENSLRASLEPAIRQSVLDEVNGRWQSVFAASCAQIKDELEQQVRQELTQFAVETLAASGTQTDRRLRELIALIEAARIQDRRRIEQALDHIESQFGNSLVTLAAQTNELQRLERN